MRIYLAGVLPQGYDVSNIYHLESFVDYYNSRREKVLETGKGLLIDSGAFTFMKGKARIADDVNLDEYAEKYIEFLKIQKSKRFFELDVDSIKGIKYVEKLRNKIESNVGHQVIPVWHRSRGIDYFKGLCRDYDYIAIGGLVTKEIKRKEYSKLITMVNYAHSQGCQIHGLGFTNIQWLPKIHWDSVDSTSWAVGTRFGNFVTFDEKEKIIKSYCAPQNGKRLKREKGKYVNYNNFIEWTKFQKYAETNL